MALRVDLAHTLRIVPTVAFAIDDVVMCMFTDSIVYVGVVNALVSADEVDIIWAKPVEEDTATCMSFTTDYPLEAGEYDDPAHALLRRTGSVVDRDTVHRLPSASYDDEREIVTLHYPLRATMEDLLRVTKLTATGYRAYHKWNDEWKTAVNIQMAEDAEKARRLCPDATGALYLDGPAAVSSKIMLARTGYTVDRLFSPNDKESVCREISHATGVYSPTIKFDAFLDMDELPKFSYVWVDGMGWWTGNVSKRHCVRDSVRALFAGKHLADTALVAYTVGIRGLKTESAHRSQAKRARYDMASQAIIICAWAKMYGYMVMSKPRLFHHDAGKRQPGAGSMMTVSFWVARIQLVD